jgi:hypothetical protein
MNLREQFDQEFNTELPRAIDYRGEHTILLKNDVIRYWKSYSEWLESKESSQPNEVCISCNNEHGSNYNHSKNGLIYRIYNHQKHVSKRRGHNMPLYNRDELKVWCFNQRLFHKLYSNWVLSGYKKLLVPSCDRINDSLGYSFDNIQLMTWGENKAKGESDRKNGINNKHSKAVIGIHIITEEKLEFHSTIEAYRCTGIPNSNISAVCKGKRKSAGGYVWEYKDDKNQ